MDSMEYLHKAVVNEKDRRTPMLLRSIHQRTGKTSFKGKRAPVSFNWTIVLRVPLLPRAESPTQFTCMMRLHHW